VLLNNFVEISLSVYELNNPPWSHSAVKSSRDAPILLGRGVCLGIKASVAKSVGTIGKRPSS